MTGEESTATYWQLATAKGQGGILRHPPSGFYLWDSSEPDVTTETLIFQFPPSSPIASCCAIGPSARLSAIPAAIITCSDIVLECIQSSPRSYDCVSDAQRPQQDQVQSDTPRIPRLFCAAPGLRLCPCCLSYLTYDPMVTDLL